jgi:hypothetical protein
VSAPVTVAAVHGPGVTDYLKQRKQQLREQHPGWHTCVSVIHTSDHDAELHRQLRIFWSDSELASFYRSAQLIGSTR